MGTVLRRIALVCCGCLLLLGVALRIAVRAETTPMGDLLMGQSVTGTLTPGAEQAYHIALAADTPIMLRYTPGVTETLPLEIRQGAIDGPIVGDISNALGDKLLYLPQLPAGDYYVILRHTNSALGTVNYTLFADITLPTTPITDPVYLPSGGVTGVYPISIGAAGPLHLIVQKPQTVETSIQLYREKIAGTPLAANTDSYSQVVSVTNATPGMYYLVMHTVQKTAPARPCTIRTLRSLPNLTMGTANSDQFTAPSQIQLYQCTATAGNPLYLALNKDRQWGAYIEVRQGSIDGPIAAQYARSGTASAAAVDQWLEVPTPTTGLYFVRIEAFDRNAVVPVPVNYTVTTYQDLPLLSDTPLSAAFSGTHAVRWYRLPASTGEPLYAFADHNSDLAVRLSVVKDNLSGTVDKTVTGTKDLLAYLPQATSARYFLKVSESTVQQMQLTGGRHLPLVANGTPAQGTLLNGADVRWYEVPVNANDEVILHLDKQTAFATALPLQLTAPTNTPASAGTVTGDRIELLSPTTSITYFVRVAGDAGTYTLRADKSFPSLQLGQAADAGMKHEGDERWFEVSVPANSPFYLVAEKTQGTNTEIDIYRDTIKTRIATFGGPTSDYYYISPRSTAARYVIRKRAPKVDFVVDNSERLYADLTLPELTVGTTVKNSIAGPYHRRFYLVTMPIGRPITLQSSLALTLEEPISRKQVAIGNFAAVAGLRAPTVAIVTAAGPVAQYTVSASTDLTQVTKAIYSNWYVEATVDLKTTTVDHVKCFTGSNVYLSDESGTGQSLLQPEGDEFATGWLLTDAANDGDSMQLTWRHSSTAVTKTLRLRGTSLRAELTCQVTTPRPLVFRNALIPAAAQNSKFVYALPNGPVVSNEYTLGTGATSLYPATPSGLLTPSENWAAFWNSGINEVYGVVLGINQQVGLSTKNNYTVARVLCPAGTTAYTVYATHPKADPPYESIRALVTQPTLNMAQNPDTALVPLGTPISHTITIKNASNAQASYVRVACPLPLEASYIDGSADNSGTYSSSKRILSWNLGNFAPGEARTLTYRYTIDPQTEMGKSLEFEATGRSNEQIDPTVARCQVTTSGPSVTSITPNTAGNTGPVTVTLRGAALTEDSTVVFSQSGQIITAVVNDVNPLRSQLRATVDVTGKEGAWELTVTNPGGALTALPNALTLSTGGKSSFWTELFAPRSMRAGVWETVSVQYGNTGTTDEVGRYILLYIPGNLYASGPVRDARGRILASSDITNSVAGPLQCWIPRTGPGETHTLYFDVLPLATRERGTNLYPEITLCVGTLSRYAVTRLIQQATITALQIPGGDQPAAQALIETAIPAGLSSWEPAPGQPLWSAVAETVKQLRVDAALAKYVTGADAASIEAIQITMVEILKSGVGYLPLIERRQYIPQVGTVGVVAEKIGPLGATSMGYVPAGEAFSYTITAQNPANATTEINEVRITDKLDTSLDLTSLRLEEVRIGKHSVKPSGTLPLQYYVDMRPDDNSIVQVLLSYNASSNELEWRCIGTDIVTGERTGFLPPNTAAIAPGGEVAVTFSVKPKTGLPSGKDIRNKASVVLDTGAPYETNETVNVLDVGAPSSAVQPLPQVQEEPSFTVSWAGQDDANGSGLACYTIYISDNGSPFSAWKHRVTYTSAVYPGVYGHSYRFYSVAEDLIGQAEDAPAAPDATIRIGNAVQIGKGTRLVSIPLMPTEEDPKKLLGFSENKWACYIPTVGYRTYGNDPEKLTWLTEAAKVPGRAFWGQWFESQVIEPTGATVPTTGSFDLQLESGWNLIGNPWTKPLQWNPDQISVIAGGTTQSLRQAATKGIISDYLWAWVPNTANPNTGKYWMVSDPSIPTAFTRLEPWQGYWIKTQQPCTLRLPATSLLATAATAAPSTVTRLFDSGWQVQLIAQTNQGEDTFNWFGTGTAEQVTRTQRMASPPASFAPSVELTFITDTGERAVDLREHGTARARWRFTVDNPTAGEDITLRWPNLTAIPNNLGLVLVNEDTGEQVYLRTASSYRFTTPADGHPVAFHIEEAVRGLLQFNTMRVRTGSERSAGMLLEYRVTDNARVNAEIRTLAGKLIQRLDAGSVSRNTAAVLRWDGRMQTGKPAISGPYLITLIAVGADGRVVRGVVPFRIP